MPSAYIIAHVTVTNPEQYEAYKKLSTIAMQAHGAELCVRGGQVEVLDRPGLEAAACSCYQRQRDAYGLLLS